MNTAAQKVLNIVNILIVVKSTAVMNIMDFHGAQKHKSVNFTVAHKTKNGVMELTIVLPLETHAVMMEKNIANGLKNVNTIAVNTA